jgi:hypothetical protein
MLDFIEISRRTKRGQLELYPEFIVKKSKDLMIRGSDFYAIWDEDAGLWSQDEETATRLIDRELWNYYEEHKAAFETPPRLMLMRKASTGTIDAFHKYCQKQMRDSFHMLDEKLVFANTKVTKNDYASRRLDYPLEKGDISAYQELLGTLYSETELRKIEWAIGSIVSGDSKKIQKFLVLYGAAGTGKSTVLNIIQMLFDGYYSTFDAKALGSSSDSFALEAFKSNPLVAIQHDGDLSRIEDNTRLNSLVSHELMTVNEKFKTAYSNRFKCFLFMGTNKPVRITDAKSGLIRRLIDVSPTGEKLPLKEYKRLYSQIPFELGAIAEHCLQVYKDSPDFYDGYIPTNMLGASNDFYNFVLESFVMFKNDDSTTLKSAWELYKTYCIDANVLYPYSQRLFKEELKNYFWTFQERATLEDGTRVRNYYTGFRADRFEENLPRPAPEQTDDWLIFKEQPSAFDDLAKDYPAQEASLKETPSKAWKNVTTTLKDIDTSKLHYVKVPENHIVIDFDLKNENGEKDYIRNLEEARKWPPTYAELSKSGAGIHLHYIYSGDPKKLSRVIGEDIELKVFTGNSSLRRKLTACVNLPIATISSGLPMQKEEKVVDKQVIKSEKALRTLIKKNLNKEIHPATKPSIDFIKKVLDDAFASGLKYDVRDMIPFVYAFAATSTHQADYCLKLCSQMKFSSEDESENQSAPNDSIIFFDVEVFPNLFVLCYKEIGEGNKVVSLINPTKIEIEPLLSRRLVGFNNRRYDNHILYARYMGYTNEMLYDLSQRIISGDRNAFFGSAYNLSYTDIYDFSSKKQSLKKFEIELGIHHQELGYRWDQPVPEEKWREVADYCKNDVIATEAVFNARHADFIAREILADIAEMSVNDTTNSLSTRIIFGKNKHPQDQFNYRDLSGGVTEESNYELFDESGRPIFPGYKYENGVSTYRGEEIGEGGYVYAEPGVYYDVALLDVSSMHPSSVIAEQLFGPEFTKRFEELKEARLAIKHKDFERAKTLLGGKLAKYLDDESMAKDLAQALKIVINSVYGLTAAKFDNPFRDIRNKDNIVAKRGALFMVNLKHAVQERGFTVAHIKTDSIKIPNATPEIIDFVMEYGKKYGYTFEHEATYKKMCLVNDAVYIAQYDNGEWTATGTQFQVPYVFKKLFSHEAIKFEDKCETKSVTSAMYLDNNEGLPEGEHNYVFVGRVGEFCPMKEGCGAGQLLRENAKDDGTVSYSAVTGTKGYRWMVSEDVKRLGLEDRIDESYYISLVDDAVETINKYGDIEQFVD